MKVQRPALNCTKTGSRSDIFSTCFLCIRRASRYEYVGGLNMKQLPQISEAEFEVMQVIWKHAPISTNEIVERLSKTTSWSPKTIQTLIKRLTTKKAITYEKESRMFVYTPLVKESEYISQESSSFLKRYYNGNISAMLSAYLENDKLSDSEIDDLRALLNKRSHTS